MTTFIFSNVHPELWYIQNEIECSNFYLILKDRRPEYLTFLPYHISIQKLDRGDNPYLENVNILGINKDNGTLDLHVFPGHHPDPRSLLWLLFHEFRHKMQQFHYGVKSNIYTESYDKWMGWLEQFADRDTLDHILHEVQPFEVDANVFACEMTGLSYNSKTNWLITDEKLKQLKIKKK